MKKIVYILFLLLLIFTPLLYFTFAPFTALANQYIYFSPCDTPIKYKIGLIDPRFNIPQSEFLQNIRQAEAIWENVNSKNMFEYDPQAELDFNMEYDNRQSLNTQIGELENRLDSGRSTLDSNIQEYERLVGQFNQRVKDLNEKISYWNSQGGAPPEEYEKLIKEQQDVNAEAQRLNDMARSLNLATGDYNAQVGELNQTINTFRQELNFRPEEGLYDSKEQKITIYITSSQNELIHTLAHEMGHALDIKHVTDEKAIMFPFSSRELLPSSEDEQALDTVCQKQNRIISLAQNFNSRVTELVHKYSLMLEKRN